MLKYPTSNSSGHSRSTIRKRAILLATAAAMLGVFAGTAQADSDPLRLLTFNIWSRFKQQPDAPAQLLIPGNYDAVLFQEESGSRYVTDLPGILKNAGLGDYQGARNGSSGIISRLPGTVGTYKLPGITSQGRDITYSVAQGDDARPTTTIGSVHFDYSDGSTNRVKEAKALSDWAKQVKGPLIMGGDFNSGDVAERGLHDVDAQIRLIQNVGNNSLYRNLAWEYIRSGDEAKMRDVIQQANPGKNIDSLSWKQWGDALSAAVKQGKDVGLKNETLPVADNTPVTMNILKKQFVMMQTDDMREKFEPHEKGDGSTTWPSYGEDATNTWASWDRAQIDHFLISRPYAKWYAITDDPADEYLGVVDKIYVDKGNGTTAPLSDHDLVGHEFTWVGPQLETYAGADGDATRLVWGEGASTFDTNKVFNLTRNNMRTDVYLGQISDENGIPNLPWLTDAEKTQLLDCTTTDARLAAAVKEYCIDDHSFIGETLVKDGGTVVVTEDAALGTASARLRLADNSGLRIDGTAMTTLDRDISLEGQGGFLSVTDAAANVTASGTISGEGSLTKEGAGTLRLTGNNTYTGDTTINAGKLVVDGTIEASARTTVNAGATLGGTGRVGDVQINQDGILAAGDLNRGNLTIAGDLQLDGGILDLIIGADGFNVTNVLGDFSALSGYSIRVSFLDGFMPGTESFFQFLNVDGQVSDGSFGLASLIMPVGAEDWGWSLFSSNGHMALAMSNPYGEIPSVPVPVPGVMLLSGLGVLAALRRRARKA